MFHEPTKASIERATVGWPGEVGSQHIELGDATNDGRTLLHVTLYRGSAPGAPLTPDGKANGFQILAQLLGPIWYIPPLGTQVLVAYPDGEAAAQGAAVIVGTMGPSPPHQFLNRSVVLDYSGMDVVIKGKSVSILSEDDDAANPSKKVRHVISVSGPGGCQMMDDSGSVCSIGGENLGGVFQVRTASPSGNGMMACMLSVTQKQISLINGTSPLASTTLVVAPTTLSVQALDVALDATGCIKLGSTALPINGAAWGASAPSVPSTRVFVAP